ncbi:hypothetical protein N9L31_00315 [bacterium]|nr:hypothetical protein [bacterium]
MPSNSTPEPDNPDAKYWPAYRSLVFDEIGPPNFDLKNGVVSHEYMTSNEYDDYLTAGNNTRFPYFNATTGVTEFVRTRGESSDGGLSGCGEGFWKNPTWNLLAMVIRSPWQHRGIAYGRAAMLHRPETLHGRM